LTHLTRVEKSVSDEDVASEADAEADELDDAEVVDDLVHLQSNEPGANVIVTMFANAFHRKLAILLETNIL
jgi:hypothetical protein